MEPENVEKLVFFIIFLCTNQLNSGGNVYNTSEKLRQQQQQQIIHSYSTFIFNQ